MIDVGVPKVQASNADKRRSCRSEVPMFPPKEIR